MVDPISTIATNFALDVGKAVAQKGSLALLAKANTKVSDLGTRLWRPNGELRVSMSALLRLRRNDGTYALIRNRHRTENYSAIGGVFKMHFPRGREQLEKFGFQEENAINDDDVTRDLRGYSRRKHLKGIKSWFKGAEAGRETSRECLVREIREELSEEFTIVPRKFPWNDLQFTRSHTAHTLKTFDLGSRILTQFQYFEIHNIDTNQASIDLLKALCTYQGDDILWATKQDIIVGRDGERNCPIGGPAELLLGPKMIRPPTTPLIASARRKPR